MFPLFVLVLFTDPAHAMMLAPALVASTPEAHMNRPIKITGECISERAAGPATAVHEINLVISFMTLTKISVGLTTTGLFGCRTVEASGRVSMQGNMSTKANRARYASCEPTVGQCSCSTLLLWSWSQLSSHHSSHFSYHLSYHLHDDSVARFPMANITSLVLCALSKFGYLSCPIQHPEHH